MKNVFLGIGTNIGNRESNIDNAIEKIEEYVGPVIKISSWYETEPWGFTAKGEFLNLVLNVGTDLSPQELLDKVLSIELLLGRVRKKKRYESRIIDIDILVYNDQIVHEDNLIIPHPLLHERRFVLVPLCELAGDMIHPVIKKSYSSLLESCKDTSSVNRYR
jgi:2-amino-4-hydroxy-6-hydroxymethyldihydropteridine diphosphokinase